MADVFNDDNPLPEDLASTNRRIANLEMQRVVMLKAIEKEKKRKEKLQNKQNNMEILHKFDMGKLEKELAEVNDLLHWNVNNSRETLKGKTMESSRVFNEKMLNAKKELEDVMEKVEAEKEKNLENRSMIHCLEGRVNGDSPKCRGCQGEFKEANGKMPMIISCGHTVCETCVKQLVTGSEIYCLECFTRFPLPSGDAKNLKKNFALLDFMFDDSFNQTVIYKGPKEPKPKKTVSFAPIPRPLIRCNAVANLQQYFHTAKTTKL